MEVVFEVINECLGMGKRHRIICNVEEEYNKVNKISDVLPKCGRQRIVWIILQPISFLPIAYKF